MNAVTLVPLQQPLNTEVTIPGSKSYTIRALLLAALTEKPVRIHSPLFSDDTEAMIRCLQALGLRVEVGSDFVDVLGSIRDIPNATATLDADLSAASIRFLLALCCIVPGVQILHGKEGLNKRPIRDLVDALRQMGADIEYLERDGYPPVRVNSSTLKPGTVQVSGSTSSQYTSALLMIAPAIGGDVTVEITGELISRPYLDMTISIMNAFGVSVTEEDPQRLTVRHEQAYQADAYTVEADASSAAYFLALAALTGSRITLKNLNPQSAQADMRFIDILAQMGNHIIRDEKSITIEGQGVRPLEVDMRDCPDQAQTLAVLAAFANGRTRITGLQSLRVKETDRLAAVQQELTKMGIQTEAKEDELTIFGGKPQAASIDTYGDHRMAMSFAVAGAVLPNLIIRNPRVVGKTFPTFWEALQQVGLEVRQPDIAKLVLIGFMGSGKSLLAPLLAERLGWKHIDMDQQVVALSGRDSIREIFELDGEPRFRELERQVAESHTDARQVVISAGGGVVTNPAVMEALRHQGITLLLEAEPETILDRLALSNEREVRPLAQNEAQVLSLYEARKPLYNQYADLRIKTDGSDKQQLLEAAVAVLQPYVEFKEIVHERR
ncbi:MAG TPA: 3-phosphoshikimate 1-carboxyvinyltransferase [Oculatellaceae cyanobacterium]|jgi:3-phosphoshikimate 1-carboxyvinyltransferase